MGSALTGFAQTFGPSLRSTNERVELRNIRQGGNDILAVLPQTGQAIWAGSLLTEVTDVVQGPFKAIAIFFRILFHPIVNFPLSLVSSAVKEGYYESSIKASRPKQTKYFARGAEVRAPILGTVSLMVGNQMRHFALGSDITWSIENSILVTKNGETKRYWTYELRPGEVFDNNCLEVVRRGRKIQVRLGDPMSKLCQNCVEQVVEGRSYYFQLDNEVAEPIQSTVTDSTSLPAKHYLLGDEIPAESPSCIQIKVEKAELHYETGRELNEAEPGSKSFLIDGKLRHFASAKLVDDPILGLSGIMNKIPRLPFKLPTRLSKFTVQTLKFVNNHMSNVIRVVVIAAGIALTLTGHGFMALGVFSAVSYEYLDHDLGIIPRKVSLFMEKWLPAVAMTGLLICGSPTSQVMAGGSLLLMIPAVNLWVHQKISRAVRPIVHACKEPVVNCLARITGDPPPREAYELLQRMESHPLLDECDAPLTDNSNLNNAQIHAILNGKDAAYEFDPAHFTKAVTLAIKLPENHKFSELIRLWEEVESKWIQPASYARLLARVLDDKRFILFMQNRFPEAKRFYHENESDLSVARNREAYKNAKMIHKNQMEEWIETLAREKKCTKQQFMADWVKEQLQFFVNKLSGSRPIEGQQHLLADAIENTAKIIPFLTKRETSPVDREDALVKLAVEGGDYCSLAMKRASSEVLEGFTEPLFDTIEESPQTKFARTVRQALQKVRLQLINEGYHAITASTFGLREESRDTGEDIHLYSSGTRALKRGFYPLEENELEGFSLTELMLKETIYFPFQVAFTNEYQKQVEETLNRVSRDPRNLRRNQALDYLRTWVQENTALNREEKEALLENDLSNDAEHLADPDNYPKWNRLLLVALGIYRQKRASIPK